MITFKEQFDKLTEAYINDEVKPLVNCACFVGNLLNNNADWAFIKCEKGIDYSFMYSIGKTVVLEESDGTYTPEEIIELEKIFMEEFLSKNVIEESDMFVFSGRITHNTENALFSAFEVALDKLKQIHESKGEVIDNYIFKKRELVQK